MKVDTVINQVWLDTIKNQIALILKEIKDPELDFISIYDLGILREIKVKASDHDVDIKVIITPSFSGCPAMLVITQMIKKQLKDFVALREQQEQDSSIKISYEIIKQLSPPWGSASVTKHGRELLRANGIAFEEDKITCPKCNHHNTQIISWFGSTACKSMALCLNCKEPFEVFKKISHL